MPVIPHIKGGPDVPVVDGGTGASTAGPSNIPGTALNNLGASLADPAGHDTHSHAGIPGVGDLTTASHSALDHQGIPGVKLVQQVVDTLSSSQDIPTAIPYDGTVPTTSDGGEILSVTLTPTSNSNRLVIEAVVHMGRYGGGGNTRRIIALFKNSASNAESAAAHFDSSSEMMTVTLRYIDTSPTTSSQTWKIRAGNAESNARINGDLSHTNPFGSGNIVSSLVVSEIEP